MIVLLILDGAVLAGSEKGGFGRLYREGKWTLRARTQYPPLTEPSLAALFHGTDATFLEAYWDDQDTYKTWTSYPPHICSLFQVLAQHGLRSTVFGTWPGLVSELTNPQWLEDRTEDPAVVGLDHHVFEKTLSALRARRSDLIVSYYEEADHVAHEHGMDYRYYRALSRFNQHVAEMMSVLDRERDLLIVVADHGRFGEAGGRDHFQYSDSTTKIPLLLWGAKIEPGHIADCDEAAIIDVAPTILDFLSLAVPHSMRGRSLLQKK